MGENVTALREPTREQRRDIRAALDLHYDTKAERYIGSETDLTIAKMVGGGCMPGWVSHIRDEDYGPDGSNESIVAVAGQIVAIMGKVEDAEKKAAAAMVDAGAAQKEVVTLRSEVASLQKSIAIIKVSVEPKAARA